MVNFNDSDISAWIEKHYQDWTEDRNKVRQSKHAGFHTSKDIGTHVAGYQTRSIEQCLNCKKKVCYGCPK